MVMPSKGYSVWHILLPLLFTSTILFNWGYACEGLETQALLQNHSRPLVGLGREIGALDCLHKSSTLSRRKSPTTCEDLEGVGSLNTTCSLISSLYFIEDQYIFGSGNLLISEHVTIECPVKGCSLTFKVSGNITVGQHASIIAGSIVVNATNLMLEKYASINTTALGGPPPPQTSGTPISHDGAGGGYGGRGASCLRSNQTNLWGGDVYAWSSLSEPWSYGSKGGRTSGEKHYGGDGGGRIMLKLTDSIHLDGSITAEGGEGGLKGGGGSGGSIIIEAIRLRGNGVISAAGGRGWGGGGGGRISLNCYSKQDVKIIGHGGESIGCPGNAGAAGTTYDNVLLSLRVSNENITTLTETPLLDFPTRPLWSNVYVENNAKALVPLLWTRVQVRGHISVLDGGSITFGLSDYPVSEFELVAEELLMSDSMLKVYGAFRMYVKMLLMWNAKILIDGDDKEEVNTSLLEARNLAVLRQNSIISSNSNLGVSGQGLLKLSGHGDAIKGQRLFLSLFYNIAVGPGSELQAPLDNKLDSRATSSCCGSQKCPEELIMPPEDCYFNSSLSFTLQVCRVEDLIVNGLVKGSIIHIHRARTVMIDADGMISTSELGCREGVGEGKFSKHGAGGGAGHGGKGGAGVYNGLLSEGGQQYGDADLPCELGSGNVGSSEFSDNVAGGGMIVMGSITWPLSRLEIYGSLKADGQSYREAKKNSNGTLLGGLGGGSGGTMLFFLQALVLGDNSSLTIVGGSGGPVGGGGGGGGRVHFHWSNVATGDEYVQIATINGSMSTSGGLGSNGGQHGGEGTITGKKCPKGLYGTFCHECPVGTYKDVDGSDPSLCAPCLFEQLPHRASFVYVRGGVTQSSCPYKCLSDKYRMPNCYTPLEELIYTFGGPWPFALLLLLTSVVLSLILSALRIKLIESDFTSRAANSIGHHRHHSFPSLLSLAEVSGTSRAEETQSHVHRMYFMGPNTFREPWHLPYSPPDAIIAIVYEDAFTRFIDEINSVAAYEWWEGSVHSILSVLACPCAWSWKQWCRRKKILRLQEYVKSEYDHACLRSCRSRALYKGMKVGSTPDLVVGYIDFFLGGDERRLDVASSLLQRFPICVIIGGDGSYMSPYNLHSDVLLTNLLGEYVPTTKWNRFVSGLNAQLRTVRQGTIRSALVPVTSWISTHGNPQLEYHGIRIELGWFQVTASGYYQLGILIAVTDNVLHSKDQTDIAELSFSDLPRRNAIVARKNSRRLQQTQPNVCHSVSRKRTTGGVNGGIINEATLKSLDYRKDFLFPLSLLLHNTRPIGFQETVQLFICIMLLGDFTTTFLTFLQYYWISVGDFLAVLLILPLASLCLFPAGLNALFSREPRRSTLARVYALWNATSISNIVVAFACGALHYGLSSSRISSRDNQQNLRREDGGWWVLPAILAVIKILQARLVDWHIANLEVPDPNLYSEDPMKFWES
ncbi:hypothetical protein QJS04_geneDACA008723 [Acorus gramineus]|uniref:DUF8003 domain-containing protein n=1 Tax=Acorus gramineus TaxID=55184 RepID=A0AAV9ADF8_ACOGR|nr:hypothetical protein QJS04_geneDACA008723 [Acorus gramineus]